MDALIAELERDIRDKADYISNIRRPHMLLSALKDLNDMVGNDELKNDVATQVDDLIDSLNNKDDAEPVMLHTLLYGVPGTGKTTVGKHLARIWYSLGYIGGNRTCNRNYKSSTDAKKTKKNDWSDIFDGLTSDDMDKFQSSYAMLMVIIMLISVLAMIWGYCWSIIRGTANVFYTMFGLKWGLIVALVLLIIIVLITIIWWKTSYGHICGKCNRERCICDRLKEMKKEADEEQRIHVSTQEVDQIRDEDLIEIVSAEDFIGQYVGWTEKKTTELLQKNKGKVLFIDEAYALVDSSGMGGSFGEKALHIINRYMSEHPEELIIIMAGYEDKIKNNLFTIQPGLARRFMWSFDCRGYTPEELFEIWKIQLKPRKLIDEKRTLELFRKNSNYFPNYAGDTLRLVNFVKLEQKRDNRRDRIPRSRSCNEATESTTATESSIIEAITPDQVERALKVLGRNTFQNNSSTSNSTMTPEMLSLLRALSKNHR